MVTLVGQPITTVAVDGSETEQEIPESEFAVELEEGEQIRPIVTEDVAYEMAPENESLTDQCGRTEKRNLGDKGWNITIEGIIIDANIDGNMGPPELIEIVELGEVYIVTEYVQGTIVVDGGQFNRDEEISQFHMNGETYRAYQFQLQLGEQSNDGGE